MKPYTPNYIRPKYWLAQQQEMELRKAIGNELYEVLEIIIRRKSPKKFKGVEDEKQMSE